MIDRLWQARRAVLFYIGLLTVGWTIGTLLQDLTQAEIQTIRPPASNGLMVTALVAFVILAAIPFVPGAEIGFAILILIGSAAALMVYLGMVGTLCLSFLVARLVPHGPRCRLLRWLRLSSAAELVESLRGSDDADRADILYAALPSGLVRRVVGHRYLRLAIAINIPGNSILGGRGGLAFASGVSGMFPFWRFALTVAIAVLPVPLAFFLLA